MIIHAKMRRKLFATNVRLINGMPSLSKKIVRRTPSSNLSALQNTATPSLAGLPAARHVAHLQCCTTRKKLQLTYYEVDEDLRTARFRLNVPWKPARSSSGSKKSSK